jgi:Xaa-Pro aminopeptidase
MTAQRFAAILAACGAAAAITVVTAGAQAGRAFTASFTVKEFADRRARVYETIGPEAVAVMQGLPSVHSSAIFRQSNEFFYVSGVVVPQAMLLMDGTTKRSILYLPKQNVSRAAVEGDLLSSDDPAATARITGVDEVKPPDQLAADLQAARGRAKAVFVPFAPTEGSSESPDGARRRTQDAAADPWDGRISRENHLRELLKTRAPGLEIKDLSPILNTMREIKSPAELAIITRATKIGGEALVEAMRSTAPGLHEYELDSLAQFIFVRHGAQGEAYRAIVASGPAAMNAHHRAGEKVMTAGELVLMDYCPDLGYYRCDVTRQWPVNGKFTPDQRDLYGFYLAVYEAVLSSIKGGLTAQQVLQNALPKMEAALAAAKFSKPIYTEAARQFVDRYRTSAKSGRGGLGHAVGMATHDFGGGSGMMRPGMVFTIEPALVIPEEQIYIRLEDMIVITEGGATIISEFVPRSIAAVEKTIAEPGLLQQYGRIR